MPRAAVVWIQTGARERSWPETKVEISLSRVAIPLLTKHSTFKVFGKRRGDSNSQKLTKSTLEAIEEQYGEFQQAQDNLLHSLRLSGGKLEPSIPGGSVTDSETLCGSESSSSKGCFTLESAVQQLHRRDDQERFISSLPDYKYRDLEPNHARVLCLH